MIMQSNQFRGSQKRNRLHQDNSGLWDMNGSILPPEIWAHVFGFLHTTNSFYSLYFLSKRTHHFPWRNLLQQLEFVMKREMESLGHFDFSYVTSLKLCGWKYGSGSTGCNTELQHLEGVHTLNLSVCKKFSNVGLSHLKGIHTLLISECFQIGDEGLSHLKGIHTLDLSGNCKRITDAGLSNLKGVHTLNLSECYQITDKGLEHLKGILTLNLRGCHQVTDRGLEYLKGVHKLNLRWCHQVTEKGLEHVKGGQLEFE
jgi:hypothetical protein